MEAGELTGDSGAVKQKSWKSDLRVIGDVFVAPSRAFGYLSSKTQWLLPFFICVLAVVIATGLTSDYRIEDMKDRLRSDPYLSTEEIQRRVNNIEAQRTSGMIGGPALVGAALLGLAQAIQLFGLAAVIWLALQLYNRKLDFMAIVSVCALSYLVLVPEALLKIPLIMAKGTTRIHLGLAAILPLEWEGSPLFNALEKVDIFSVWMVVLLVIGLPIVVGITKKQAAITVGYLWGIWLLISMFIGNLVQVG